MEAESPADAPAEVAMFRHAPRSLAVVLVLALVTGCGGGGGNGETVNPHPLPEALVRCAGQGAARMFVMVATFDGILRHMDFTGDVPPGVREFTRLTYDFAIVLGGVSTDHVSVEAGSSSDISSGIPINAPVWFHWVLDRGAGSTGEGQFTLTRLSQTTVQVIPSGHVNPWLEPDTTCTVELPIIGFFVNYTSDPAAVEPNNSVFDVTVAVGSDMLASHGSVGFSAVAAMTASYWSTTYTYTINLRTGAVTLPP
jgi:hypothetical protein